MLYTYKMNENEYWWGGTAADGTKCPFNAETEIEHNFSIWAGNQTMPMYLSNQGRCIWSEEPFEVKISGGVFEIEGKDVVLEQFGTTLKEAYLGAMAKHFPPSGKELARKFFKVAQYNTWMQMIYNQTQEGVMKYARGIIENGFAPGIFMIDEGWQKDYDNWDFDPYKFPEPKKMIDELHEMGFTVMLWVTPNVRPDGEYFVKHISEDFNPEEYDKIFLRNEKGEPAICWWWNGYSAVLDFTKECDSRFLKKQLDFLVENYGIDGFKFDGGSIWQYGSESCINGPFSLDATVAERNIAWNEFGSQYEFHEYKDTFKGGGKRTIQRIQDRTHSWEEHGLATLVPTALLQGVLGHPFICPDMIGGGSWIERDQNEAVDEELFVRMAQCSALFPMMQFSWAPWEAVGSENLERIKAAEKLHTSFSELILELVDKAHTDGEPIIRSLEYNYPNKGYHTICDTFMLGEKLLVAPVLEKGAENREVTLPDGEWEGFDGKIYIGGKKINIPVTLDSVPYFIKK